MLLSPRCVLRCCHERLMLGNKRVAVFIDAASAPRSAAAQNAAQELSARVTTAAARSAAITPCARYAFLLMIFYRKLAWQPWIAAAAMLRLLLDDAAEGVAPRCCCSPMV